MLEREFAGVYGALQTWHWWFRGREKILAAVMARELRHRTSLSIASLGCGPPEGLVWLLPFAAPRGRVVGLDVDPLHARLVLGLEYVVGRLEAVPLASCAFDLVLALDVLEHLDDDAEGLHEAIRLLRPGGLLLLTVPARPSLWSGHDVLNRHRRRYTKQSLSQTFARAGLPAPRLTYFNTLLFLPVAIVRSLRTWKEGIRPHNNFADTAPGVLNELLTRVFATERHLVYRIPLPVGVSLLALYRKSEG